MRSLLKLLLPFFLYMYLATACNAGCDECGCANECSGGKICKLVCEEKTISVDCYKCEEEQFCIPDPSCKGCKHCELACDGANGKCSSDGCAESCCNSCQESAPKSSKWFVWFNWKPTTAQIATKKKLYKKTVKKKVPSYKWVVVDTCECGACATNFQGTDTGYVKKAPLGLEPGHSIEASKSELQRLAKNRTKSIVR